MGQQKPDKNIPELLVVSIFWRTHIILDPLSLQNNTLKEVVCLSFRNKLGHSHEVDSGAAWVGSLISKLSIALALCFVFPFPQSIGLWKCVFTWELDYQEPFVSQCSHWLPMTSIGWQLHQPWESLNAPRLFPVWWSFVAKQREFNIQDYSPSFSKLTSLLSGQFTAQNGQRAQENQNVLPRQCSWSILSPLFMDIEFPSSFHPAHSLTP